MTFENVKTKALLWIAFFSFAVLAHAIATNYKILDPYLTPIVVDSLLILFAVINLGLAVRLIHIHGSKPRTIIPICIGLMLAWWSILVSLILKLASLLM